MRSQWATQVELIVLIVQHKSRKHNASYMSVTLHLCHFPLIVSSPSCSEVLPQINRLN